MKQLIYSASITVIMWIAIMLMAAVVFSSRADAVTLQWDEPTVNTDGSCYTDPGGWDIHWGSQTGVYTESLRVQENDPKISFSDSGNDAGTGCGDIIQYTYGDLALAEGTWYVVLEAVDSSGNKSDYSNEVSSIIQVGPNPPSGLITVNVNVNVTVNP